MKNSKITTYILLTLVLGVWGYVIYVVFTKVNDNNEILVHNLPKTTSPPNLNYYLWKTSLHYDDIVASPFGENGTVELLPENNEAQYMEENQPVENYDELAYAPAVDIQYLGYIENEKLRQKVAIVQINGKQQYMRTKQSIDGYTLISINATEIEFKTNLQVITIAKQ